MLKTHVLFLTAIDGHQLQANATFVHTLNTESGLIRKVDALGVGNWGRLLESEPATYAAAGPL